MRTRFSEAGVRNDYRLGKLEFESDDRSFAELVVATVGERVVAAPTVKRRLIMHLDSGHRQLIIAIAQFHRQVVFDKQLLLVRSVCQVKW